MILELFEYLLSPCSKNVRSMGFLSSSIQVRARYRRCRYAWAPHLHNTQRAIMEAVKQCRSRRKVVVFGAGMLHDIPLRELSRQFNEVLLVDIAHPLSSRLRALRFGNVAQVCWDVTEIMDQLCQTAPETNRPLPVSCPVRFVDDPQLDLTLSVNLLSQLSYVPGRYLEQYRDEKTIGDFSKHLIEAHLDYLCRLPGNMALITDVAVKRVSREGRLVEKNSALCGIKLPPPQLTWEWRLAPSPELEPGIDILTDVVAYPDWKSVACKR